MKKGRYRVIGVMSGTSLDGIDLALLEFEKDDNWSYSILSAETVAYPREWQQQLAEAITYDDARLQKLNKQYTYYLAEVISAFLEKHKVVEPDAICSHGHTIQHEPEKGLTLQIGNLPVLAQLLEKKVICDFRVQDVKLGGQGAPLVPIGDKLLFGDYEYCLNLGGFANISTSAGGSRIAYDICPVNTVLNFLAEKIGLKYDENGAVAASGELDNGLLEKLNNLTYYTKKPPKSLGVEWVRKEVLPLVDQKEDVPAVLRTFSAHVAYQITRVLDDQPGSTVLVTGGGAFNNFILEQIRQQSKNDIIIPGRKVVEFKEALIFGFLGVLKLRNEVNVLKSVTGASRDHSSGKVFIPEQRIVQEK